MNRKQTTAASVAPCRFCGAPLTHTFVDLGSSPLCQRHIEPHQLNQMEPFYPLHVRVCDRCYLVQLEEYVSPAEIFNDYAYFSSFSESWLAHAKAYVDAITPRLGLGASSLVVEIASNDGYLLQYFKERGVPVLGVEPAANVAAASIAKGIHTVSKFFGEVLAERLATSPGQADLVLGNNVLAHVPDINDFVAGIAHLLKPGGVVTMEFPHLQQLIENNQFDTIYHEHFSYLGFVTVQAIFAAHGLTVFDVDELPTHGGSLRIYARHKANGALAITDRVRELTARETKLGYTSLKAYQSFGPRAMATKRKLLSFLIAARDAGKSIAAYGAPGKGNTLLNYCGIRTDFIDYTVDRNPKKQGNYLPGSRIPICHPDRIRETRPDYLLILPWNLETEIVGQNDYIREWGGRFVVPIPEVRVL